MIPVAKALYRGLPEMMTSRKLPMNVVQMQLFLPAVIESFAVLT